MALAAGGCASRARALQAAAGRASQPTSATTLQKPRFAMIVVQQAGGPPAKTVAALQAFYPAVTWVNDIGGTGSSGTGIQRESPAHTLPAWGVGEAVRRLLPAVTPSLLPAIRLANLNAKEFLPGALSAFTRRDGSAYGVPTGVEPVAVAYNVAAFKAAGLSAPASNWSLADFRVACATLESARSHGRLPNPIARVLPPLAGHANIGVDWIGSLADPRLWAGFAIGFGGAVVNHGRFDLTGASTVKGIGSLVDLARQFGGGQSALPSTVTAADGLFATTAMFFIGYPTHGYLFANPTVLPSGYRLARFPKLPSHAVVPVTPRGIGLVRTGGSVGTWTWNFRTAPDWAMEAAVAYARWVYSVNRHPLAYPGVQVQPPALADGAAQTDYWSSPSLRANGAAAVGDWQEMQVVQAGWPETGSDRAKDPFLSKTEDIVLTGLTKAVFDGDPVPAVLADITKQLNAAADQYAAADGSASVR